MVEQIERARLGATLVVRHRGAVSGSIVTKLQCQPQGFINLIRPIEIIVSECIVAIGICG